MSTLADFKARLRGGGSRNSLFRVTINFPSIVGGNGEEASFLIKAASMPASSVAAFDVNYRGQPLKIAGKRTFEDWSVTVLNDTNMSLRNSFEKWMQLIHGHGANTSAFIGNAALTYMSNLKVEHLDRNNRVTKVYDFIDAFPTSVASIDLSYDGGDNVEEFGVTFSYQYWVSATNNIGA